LTELEFLEFFGGVMRSGSNRQVFLLGVLLLSLLTFSSFVESQKADSAKAQAIVKQMSDKLSAAKSFSFSTKEITDKIRRSGKKEKRNVTREAIVTRPNKFWERYAGETDWQIWYDGKFITAVSDSNKAFIQRAMPPTIDESMDVLSERLGMDLPISDFIYSSPYDSFMSAKANGGYVGTQQIEGVTCSHLSYKGEAADWKVWINEETSLPCKFEITYKENPGVPFYSIIFTNWNFSPEIKPDTFTYKIPEGYERLPIMERVRLSDEEWPQAQTKPKN
jgi:hypothetical protein